MTRERDLIAMSSSNLFFRVSDSRLSEIYFGYYARNHAYHFCSPPHLSFSPSLSIFRKHTDIAPLARVWREVWHDGERAPGIFRQATVWYALFVLDVAAVATVVPVTARCPPRYRYALSATRCVCIVHSCYVTLVIVCASLLHAYMEKGRLEGGFAAVTNERRAEKKRRVRPDGFLPIPHREYTSASKRSWADSRRENCIENKPDCSFRCSRHARSLYFFPLPLTLSPSPPLSQ